MVFTRVCWRQPGSGCWEVPQLRAGRKPSHELRSLSKSRACLSLESRGSLFMPQLSVNKEISEGGVRSGFIVPQEDEKAINLS